MLTAPWKHAAIPRDRDHEQGVVDHYTVLKIPPEEVLVSTRATVHDRGSPVGTLLTSPTAIWIDGRRMMCVRVNSGGERNRHCDGCSCESEGLLS